MIRGQFIDPRNGARPAAHVGIDVQTVEGGAFRDVSFLIDTGADHSSIFPIDASRLWRHDLQYDFGRDPSRSTMGGIGSVSNFILREMSIRFTDDAAGVIEWTHPFWIAPPTAAELWGVPSLLGRDLLGRSHSRLASHETS